MMGAQLDLILSRTYCIISNIHAHQLVPNVLALTGHKCVCWVYNKTLQLRWCDSHYLGNELVQWQRVAQQSDLSANKRETCAGKPSRGSLKRRLAKRVWDSALNTEKCSLKCHFWTICSFL